MTHEIQMNITTIHLWNNNTVINLKAITTILNYMR